MRCIDCGSSYKAHDGSGCSDLCERCHTIAGYENQHGDEGHAGALEACPICGPNLPGEPTAATAPALHVFEKAGLGLAPFRFIGHESRVGPMVIYDKNGRDTGFTTGAPGQPMGSCDYCGTGIAICCTIKSSDGKIFIVGSDCVAKTGDAGLKRVVNKMKSDARKAREQARITAAVDALPKIEKLLSGMEHPNKWRADAGENLHDWCNWMLKNSGHTGRLKVARTIEKTLKLL